jgi:predicted membrane protein
MKIHEDRWGKYYFQNGHYYEVEEKKSLKGSDNISILMGCLFGGACCFIWATGTFAASASEVGVTMSDACELYCILAFLILGLVCLAGVFILAWYYDRDMLRFIDWDYTP